MDKEIESMVIPDDDVYNAFSLYGDVLSCKPVGNGHIHVTFLLTTSKGKYILQKLNTDVFKDVESMNSNISRVLKQVDNYQRKHGLHRFSSLELIDTRDGNSYYQDSKENAWRLMNYIDDTVCVETVENADIAFEAAASFGYFQKCLLKLNPDEFKPSIPDFHNLAKRIANFDDVLQQDPVRRRQYAEKEIIFAIEHKFLALKLDILLSNGKIPLRVTHNDTKVNNVLLDKTTMKGRAVIDLDTVMPGLVLFDFGDMVRTSTSPAAEDETDLSKVVFRKDIYDALVDGYLSELGDVIKNSEKDNLLLGAKIMIYMIGLRFLTDYLDGDNYFSISRPDHNLHRCRTQFKLLEEVERIVF